MAAVLGFVGVGLSSVFGGLFGIAHTLLIWPADLILIAAIGLLVGGAWYTRRQVDSLALGALAGLLAQYAVTGLVRIQLGLEEAGARRYTYVAATFLLIVIADAIRGTDWTPIRRRALAVSMLVIALLSNVTILAFTAIHRGALSDVQQVELQTVAAVRGAPGLSPEAKMDPDITDNLTPEGYFRAVDRLGSPAPAARVEDLATLPPRPVEQALSNIFGPSLRVSDSSDAIVGAPSLCGDIVLTSGSVFSIDVPSAGRMTMAARGPGQVEVFLWYRSQDAVHRKVRVSANPTTVVTVPDSGRLFAWKLGFVGSGRFATCVYPGPS
jgi:hypothetical protein